MRADVVAAATRDPLHRLLERWILERLHLAAVVADEVVVVLAARVGGLEARDAVSQVDPLHEAGAGEALEHAVDARDPDP